MPDTPSEAKYELTVVMPCLNEADTLEICIQKAQKSTSEHNISTEIIVADNGSTDGSIEIAQRNGARVVNVEAKGYGNALMGGIAAANSEYVIMGDADDSYDFLEVPKFVEKLREGYDLVQGCRLPSGGGRIMPGAMPFLHRVWGNPMFSWMVRNWFHAPIHDVYCGLRGFRKDTYLSLEQRCTGMEFATEMIIKNTIYRKNIAEVPITLHQDGRKAHAPHLKTFRDGWRTMRFFMIYCPRWLYLLPALLLFAFGGLGFALVYSHTSIAGAQLDVHTLLAASVALMMGYQSLIFGTLTKVFAIGEHLMPMNDRMRRLLRVWNLESGIVAGFAVFLLGIGLFLYAVMKWAGVEFGDLDYSQTMRVVIPGMLCIALGFQTILSSFFLSLLDMRRK